jgi:Fic family protein
MEKEKRWIWEFDNYPSFVYDQDIINPLIQKVTLSQGYLTAFTNILNNENLKQRQLNVLSQEAISTSEIEGEKLNRDSVRSSIKNKLGLFNLEDSKVDIKTDNLIEILIDANTNYNEALKLERLFGWHNALFPTGYSGFNKINVAKFREDSIEVVTGAIGQEKTRYIAPKYENLKDEINRFISWFNNTPDTLIKASIVHLWFVIIHPFDDGNGRIARAITDLVLSKIEESKISKLYSMSSAINKDRKNYYEILDYTTGFKYRKDNILDITKWIEWFLNTLLLSLEDAKLSLSYIIEKTNFWDKCRDKELNQRQIKVLNKILDIGIANFEGGLTKRKYIAISKASSTTASRDLLDLIEKGCIRQVEGSSGRSVRYEIVL